MQNIGLCTYGGYNVTWSTGKAGEAGDVKVYDPQSTRNSALYRTTSLELAYKWIDAYRDGQQEAISTALRPSSRAFLIVTYAASRTGTKTHRRRPAAKDKSARIAWDILSREKDSPIVTMKLLDGLWMCERENGDIDDVEAPSPAWPAATYGCKPLKQR